MINQAAARFFLEFFTIDIGPSSQSTQTKIEQYMKDSTIEQQFEELKDVNQRPTEF